MKLNSHNEWEPLKAVVVGTVDGFRPGLNGLSEYADRLESAQSIAMKAFPQWYLDEVAEDLEALCSVLREAGVTVLRPHGEDAWAAFSGPIWSASGYDGYNVRDLQVVFGDTLVESASASRSRIFESFGLRSLYLEHLLNNGMRWICAPTPRLPEGFLEVRADMPTALERMEETRHAALSGGTQPRFRTLRDDEIVFDAANIIRVGEDVIYLLSSTGNSKGARWLSSVLGPRYRVHPTEAYRASHLDSTILPLRPGLVLLNGARVNETNVPEIFERWDRFYFEEPVPLPQTEMDIYRDLRLPLFHELSSIGFNSDLDQLASPWVGLNVLSISPEIVLVEARQEPLMRSLEAKGLTVLPVQMRHCYTMLGGLHCTTLDLERDSELLDYR